MKAIIAAIAAIGSISTFAGAAMADVSINLRFGSTPSYRSYESYHTNVYRQVYPSYPNYYEHYNHNVNSSVVVREVYPSNYYYGNRWYEHRRNSYQGDRYIVEKRIIYVR